MRDTFRLARVTTTAAEQVQELSPWRLAGAEMRSRRRKLLLALLIFFVGVTTFIGFPTGREVLTGGLLLALLAACGGDVRLWRKAVVRDWLPLLIVLFAYDLLRGIANEVGGALFHLQRWHTTATGTATARAHLTPPLNADKALFGGTVPTTWLQDHFYDPGTAHWYDVVATFVYLSHFLVSLGLAVVLWCVGYTVFRRYLAVLVTLTLAALATYVLYPMAPPWMAAVNGKLPPVGRVVEKTLGIVGGGTLSSAVERGAAYSNPVAAMPSLHAGIPVMLLLFFWPLVRTTGRVALVTYALTMAVTLVYAGEHYVIDVLVGWTYAAIVVLTARRVTNRRDAGA
ncbi:MAG: hypothetical protein JWM40_494 [Frankiales bacterium]|nr:hypothetical protein [Frankiales bacterium]